MIGPMLSGPLSDMLAARAGAGGRVGVVLGALGLSPLGGIAVYTSPDPTLFYLRFTLYSIILTMWLPPLYAVLYEQVLPRMRGQTAALYILLMTILGLGIGPYWVGMVADRTHGNLGLAILSVNGLAPLIVVLLVMLWRRAERDAAGALGRARAAGEPVLDPRQLLQQRRHRVDHQHVARHLRGLQRQIAQFAAAPDHLHAAGKAPAGQGFDAQL
eukprot:gene13810-17498_t